MAQHQRAYIQLLLDHPDLAIQFRGHLEWTPRLRDLLIRTHLDLLELAGDKQTHTDRMRLTEDSQQ